MSGNDIRQDDELAAAIRVLADTFVARLPANIDAMHAELRVIDNDPANLPAWKNLHRHLHSLAGSAGTFGFNDLGDRARALEHRINQALKGGATALEADRPALVRDQISYMEWVQANFFPI